MAGKSSANYAEQQKALNLQIKNQQFSGIYLLSGQQDYLRVQNRDKLIAALVPQGDTMNYTYFTGNSVPVQEVADLADTLPFFSDHRVIVLEGTDLLTKAGPDADFLADYLDRLPESTCMIFMEEKPDGKTRLVKKIRKLGFELVCDTPDEQSLRMWTARLFASNDCRIDNRALEMFLSGTGDDMLNITNEARKLSDYCMGKGIITTEDVRAICSVRTKDRIFDMIAAIMRKDRRGALEIYMELLDLQTPPQVILSLMIRQYNQMLQACALLQSATEAQAAAQLGIAPFILKNRIRPLLRSYTEESLISALDRCLQVNMDYRSGKTDAGAAVEQLIIVNTGASS